VGKMFVSNVVGATTTSCIVERKRFVKNAVSLVNIVEMALDDADKVYLPKEVIELLGISNILIEDIPEDVIDAVEKAKGDNFSSSDLSIGVSTDLIDAIENVNI